MPSEQLDTVETLLRTLLDETEGPEVHYKLRTALQLLAVHRQEVRGLKAAAGEDEDLEARLRELGYID